MEIVSLIFCFSGNDLVSFLFAGLLFPRLSPGPHQEMMLRPLHNVVGQGIRGVFRSWRRYPYITSLS